MRIDNRIIECADKSDGVSARTQRPQRKQHTHECNQQVQSTFRRAYASIGEHTRCCFLCALRCELPDVRTCASVGFCAAAWPIVSPSSAWGGRRVVFVLCCVVLCCAVLSLQASYNGWRFSRSNRVNGTGGEGGRGASVRAGSRVYVNVCTVCAHTHEPDNPPPPFMCRVCMRNEVSRWRR